MNTASVATPKSSSLDRSETSEHFSRDWVLFLSREQARIHGRLAKPRALVLSKLAASPENRHRKRLRSIECCCVGPLYVMDAAGAIRTSPGLCRDRACPLCQKFRARDLTAKVASRVARMNAPRFLTLTLQHTDQPLPAVLDRLYTAFREMRRHADWKAHVLGGVAAVEVTRNPGTGHWHPHIHAIVDGVYWSHASIKALWSKITGDSYIVHIEACPDRAAAARYVTSYIAKAADLESLPAAAFCEYCDAMTGRRLLITYGNVYRVPNPDACCTAPVKAAVLCSTSKLTWAASRDCPYASLALCLLRKLGGFAAAPLFDNPGPRADLTTAETSQLHIALKRVGGDAAAWLPEIEETRRFSGQPHAGLRPRWIQARIFEDPADPHRGTVHSQPWRRPPGSRSRRPTTTKA